MREIRYHISYLTILSVVIKYLKSKIAIPRRCALCVRRGPKVDCLARRPPPLPLRVRGSNALLCPAMGIVVCAVLAPRKPVRLVRSASGTLLPNSSQRGVERIPQPSRGIPVPIQLHTGQRPAPCGSGAGHRPPSPWGQTAVVSQVRNRIRRWSGATVVNRATRTAASDAVMSPSATSESNRAAWSTVVRPFTVSTLNRLA